MCHVKDQMAIDVEITIKNSKTIGGRRKAPLRNNMKAEGVNSNFENRKFQPLSLDLYMIV